MYKSVSFIYIYIYIYTHIFFHICIFPKQALAVGVLADIGWWTGGGPTPLEAFTEKVALLRTALVFKKKELGVESGARSRHFSFKKHCFLIFRCRHGGFLGRPRPRRCPGPWLCGFLPWIPLLDSSPGFLSGFLAWIPLLDSSSGFLFWIPLLDSSPDSYPGFLFWIPLPDPPSGFLS